jgi:hypothetical protein
MGHMRQSDALNGARYACKHWLSGECRMMQRSRSCDEPNEFDVSAVCRPLSSRHQKTQACLEAARDAARFVAGSQCRIGSSRNPTNSTRRRIRRAATVHALSHGVEKSGTSVRHLSSDTCVAVFHCLVGLPSSSTIGQTLAVISNCVLR